MSDLTQIFGGQPFNAGQVEPAKAWEPVAPGMHPALIRSAAFKATKNGSGQYLQIDMDIIDGPEKGRKLTDRLNLFNSSEKAVNMAKASLSALCRSMGEMVVSQTEQLLNKTTIALVTVKDDRNNIQTYFTPQQARDHASKQVLAPPVAPVMVSATAVQPMQQAVPQPQQPIQSPVANPVVQSVQRPMQQPVNAVPWMQ
jgi:hypothetical protein